MSFLIMNQLGVAGSGGVAKDEESDVRHEIAVAERDQSRAQARIAEAQETAASVTKRSGKVVQVPDFAAAKAAHADLRGVRAQLASSTAAIRDGKMRLPHLTSPRPGMQ